MGKSTTLAQQFAEAQNTVMKDFDPEEDGPAQQSDEESGSGDSADDLAGTEHYVEVGQSKLRKRDEVPLGPQYTGSRISREALLDDDEDSGDSDSEPEASGGSEEAARISSANSLSKSKRPTIDKAAFSRIIRSGIGFKRGPAESTTFANPEDVEIDVDEEDGDIDSDNAFGESDIEKFKSFTFRGSSKPRALNGVKNRPTAADFMFGSETEKNSGDESGEAEAEIDEDLLDIEEQHEENVDDDSLEDRSTEGSQSDEVFIQGEEEPSDGEGSEDESSNDSEDGDEKKAQRAELRKIMNEEQKTVVETISQAAKLDADKGNAVKRQRKAFDSLLSVRMVLQKSLVASNSMTTVEEKDFEEASEEPYHAAEDAAIKLWNTLDKLRHELIKANGTSMISKKRKRDVDSSTLSSKIWQRMQALEVASIDTRQMTLEKWWGKVRRSTTPLTGKLNNNVISTSLTSVIQEQLAKPETFAKTKRPRSCAPVQEKSKLIEDPNIYDDTALYKTLLNQLVEQRKMDSGLGAGGGSAPAQWAVKETKMRKVVDTKASKGRKMRFTVHEKLQNFMAPEDRSSWEQLAVDRFFGTLLGQKMTLKEEDMEIDDQDEDQAFDEDESLKLFQS